jgi:hypothetical protein
MPSPELITRAAKALTLAGPDAVLTSHTAMRLYGCETADDDHVHVLLPHKRWLRARRGVTVHRTPWEPRQTETIHGLKVLALEHALADMLCREQAPTAFSVLTQALATHPDGLRARIAHSLKTRASPRTRKKAQILLNLSTGLPTLSGEL